MDDYFYRGPKWTNIYYSGSVRIEWGAILITGKLGSAILRILVIKSKSPSNGAAVLHRLLKKTGPTE